MPETPDELAERALRALQSEDPREARKLLMEAVNAAPGRADLLNALGTVQLQLGEPELGKPLIEQAVSLATEALRDPARLQQAEVMVEGFLLGLAAACEDLDEPDEAEAAYLRVMEASPGQPRARIGRAHLLLAWGEVARGRAELEVYVEEDRDEDPFIDSAGAYLTHLGQFIEKDIHPREFLAAHRGSYVEMFDHYAAGQEKLGWIAEAARMRRSADGGLEPMIPDDARPYAAVRVDLVNPQTSEIGQVGDQPMIVAIADYQALARAPVLIPWRELAFDLRISSQCPWDQLPIQLLFADTGAADDLDAVIADWYTAGWNGAFGSKDAGRFHYISDPELRRDGRAVVYHADLGRAALHCMDDLIRRLTVLHEKRPIQRAVLGRGYLPVGARR